MSWPTMSDYQEAIQNPANCFSDPSLKSGTPALNALGLPQPITGGFCSVYKVTSGRTRWAVRCFLHDIQDLRDRYAHISRYLRGNRPRHMVGFEYVLEGIRVHGEWHPVLKMEWVEGDTLDVWIEKHVHDPKALRGLAGRWDELLEALDRARIGHCDLQHGNVLVDGSDQLRLIDYDGMYVPPLRGRGSHEKGHPAYQHPEREGEDFDVVVDRFPGLVIQTSLLALAEAPELWERFYVGDNLIFRRSDFQSPDSAPVFEALAKLGGPASEHAEALRDACKRRLDKTPVLRDIKPAKAGKADSSDSRVLNVASKITQLFNSARPKRPASKSRPASAPQRTPTAKSSSGKSRPASQPAAKIAGGPAGKSRAGSQPAAKIASGPAGKSRSGSQPAVSAPAAARAAAAAAAAKPAKKRQVTSAPATTVKPATAQPAWMSNTAAAPPAVPRIVPAPPAAVPPPHSTMVSSPATPAAPPQPRRAVASASAAPVATPAPRKPAAVASATPGTGWAVAWTRPEKLLERHQWKVPVYEHHESPRLIAGIHLGTRHEKIFERFEDKLAERMVKLDGHRSAVTSLAFTPDARLLVSGSRDGTVRVWDVPSGLETCAPLKVHSGVQALKLVPNRTMVAAALDNRGLVLWDYGPQRHVIHLATPDRSPLKAVAVSADGHWVAAGGSRRNFFLWQTDGEAVGSAPWVTSGRVEALAFTADAGGIVCGTHKGQLELFDRASGDAQWSNPTGLKRIVALATAPRANGVFGAAANGTIAAWDTRDGGETLSVQPARSRLASFAVSPDASLLFAGYASGAARLLEAGTHREVTMLGGHPGAVTAVALPAAGRLAATGAKDGSVRLWAVR